MGTSLAEGPLSGDLLTLEFTSQAHLSRAFEELLSSEHLEDCLVETDLARLRFVAPPGHAEALLERVYRQGGLRWCSRQRLARS
jgi:hypothetical protein